MPNPSLKIAELLHEGLAHHQSGRVHDAKHIYECILKIQSDHFDALQLLGAVFIQQKNPKLALEYIDKAIRINPFSAIVYNNRGNALRNLARIDEALCSYDEAIRLKPDYSEAYYNRANTLRDLNQFEDALKNYNQAIQLKPDYAQAHNNRGNVLKELKQIDDALQSYTEAIRFNSNYGEAYFNRGATLQDLNLLDKALSNYSEAIRLKTDNADAYYNHAVILQKFNYLEEALKSYSEAISLKPDYAEAYNNRGIVLQDFQRLDEAFTSYAEAIRLNPYYAGAHYNLGNILKELNRLDEAISRYDEAIRLKPEYADAHYNRANVLQELNRLDEALKGYDQAIALRSDHADALNNRGIVLRNLNRLLDALNSYEQALRIKPDFAEAYTNLGALYTDLGELTKAEDCHRKAIRLKPEFVPSFSNLLFTLNYVESLTPEFKRTEAIRYGSMVSRMSTPKFMQKSEEHELGKLRVGFVSGDLRNHPVGYFIEGLVKHLDSSQFELYAFPTFLKTDELTSRIKPYFKEWMPLYGKTDYEAASLIHDQHIQVLIDLSGHSGLNRLPVFSYRPAYVQASWLGYFATTGLPEMDYFLGDPIMSPQSEEHHFTEKVWKLAQTWLCLELPSQAVAVSEVPALTNGYITFGCFGNLSKMNDEVIKTWSSILKNIPHSKLLLKSKQLADLGASNEVLKRFAVHHIFADRLILEGPSSRQEYLRAYDKVDIVLDTFPYPGGTTSVDALWMGVPVLTLKGNQFLSHLGESIAFNAGQTSWIAQNRDDYIYKAISLASDTQFLALNRKTSRDQVIHSPLFDMHNFAKNFGDALWGMWKAGPKIAQHND